MKLRFLLPLFASSLLLFSCGGGSSAHDELTSVMTEISAVLETVKDADTAKSARESLEPLTGRLAKLQAEMAEKVGPEVEGIDPDDAKEFAEATTRYSTELTRIASDPALYSELEDVLAP